jgi:4-amino-4-deoxy-L-arabinose transferase-like glycosyltransferase
MSSMTKRRLEVLAWLVVVTLAFGRPLFRGLGEADMENDEALHSMVAQSILDTGDWMTPHAFVPSLDPDFVEKPPLKFWLVAAPIKAGLLRADELGYRVWDALFGAVTFLYLFALGRLVGGAWAGLSAAFVLFAYQPIVFDHGFRTNNMDAALVLSYCGGLFHFIRWARATSPRGAWNHALATGGWFLLGLMTKFVAVAFLPASIGAASLVNEAVRTRVLRAWRTWAVVAAVALACAGPWFVYQTVRSGAGFWQIILGEHVVKRFSAGLDPAHLKPWGYYFQVVFQELTRAHAFWLAAGGAVLLLWRTVQEDWFEGTLVLSWFWLPIPLISLGSSKLGHYLYPFVPALALWAGYGISWAGHWVAGRLSGTGRARRWTWAVQAGVAVLLLAAGPARAYPGTYSRLGTETHPMRTLRDCLVRVRAFQSSAGERQAPMFVWLPTGYQHPFFYYFANVGWSMHDDYGDDALRAALDEDDARMSVLMPLRDYERFLLRTGRSMTMVPAQRLGSSIMLLPGPMSACGRR